MPTYCSLNYHVVFATKNRLPTIERVWMPRLHAFVEGIVRDLGGIALSIGGVEDHVHLLVSLKPAHCLADVVRDMKKSSSGWVHDQFGAPEFSWQRGYAAFTLSHSGIPTVRSYLLTQEEHHHGIDSYQELLDMCREAGIKPEMQFFE